MSSVTARPPAPWNCLRSRNRLHRRRSSARSASRGARERAARERQLPEVVGDRAARERRAARASAPAAGTARAKAARPAVDVAGAIRSKPRGVQRSTWRAARWRRRAPSRSARGASSRRAPACPRAVGVAVDHRVGARPRQPGLGHRLVDVGVGDGLVVARHCWPRASSRRARDAPRAAATGTAAGTPGCAPAGETVGRARRPRTARRRASAAACAERRDRRRIGERPRAGRLGIAAPIRKSRLPCLQPTGTRGRRGAQHPTQRASNGRERASSPTHTSNMSPSRKTASAFVRRMWPPRSRARHGLGQVDVGESKCAGATTSASRRRSFSSESANSWRPALVARLRSDLGLDDLHVVHRHVVVEALAAGPHLLDRSTTDWPETTLPNTA